LIWNANFDFDAFVFGVGFLIGAIAGFVVGDFMIGFRDSFTRSSDIVPRFRIALPSVRLSLINEASKE
jgi:hypothetical protein